MARSAVVNSPSLCLMSGNDICKYVNWLPLRINYTVTYCVLSRQLVFQWLREVASLPELNKTKTLPALK